MNLICSITLVLCWTTCLNAENKYVELNNGLKMPQIGYGTFMSAGDSLEKALEVALEAGYRHIDTATFYQNEDIIGNVLKRWFSSGKIKREDLFLVTKLPSSGMRPELVQKFLKESLEKLQVGYVDLYLIHGPVGLKYEEGKLYSFDAEGNVELDLTTNLTAVWKTMEEQVDLGLTKSIGVSNFNNSQVERILNGARIPPVTNQVELHLYYQQKDLVKLCKEHNIVVTAYSPIGAPGLRNAKKGETTVLSDPAVLELAKKYNKTPAQILLRHGIQKGLVVIPKSVTPARIQENINIFDFELSEADVERLNGLDKGVDGRLERTGFKGFKKHPEAGSFW